MKKKIGDLKVGRELEVREIEAKPRLIKEWTKAVIALAFVAGCVAAVLIAAFGWVDEERSNAVLRVWAAIAAPFGAIITHYFWVPKASGERDN